MPAAFWRLFPPPRGRLPPLIAACPPISQFASTRITDAPLSAAATAAGRPVAPAPITTTSVSRSQVMGDPDDSEKRSVIVVAVVPLVVGVAVRLRGDVRLEAALRELLLEL